MGQGVGQAVDPHFDPHFFQRFYNKKAPKTEVFGAFWSCWADSNRRPHPYQCEQRLFTAFHKLSKSLISSRFSDFPSRALSFPLIPSNSNKEQIKNKRGSNLGASFCTGAEHHNLLCNDLQIKAYPAGICICNQAVPVHNVKTQSTVLNREIAFTVKDRHLRE